MGTVPRGKLLGASHDWPSSWPPRRRELRPPRLHQEGPLPLSCSCASVRPPARQEPDVHQKLLEQNEETPRRQALGQARSGKADPVSRESNPSHVSGLPLPLSPQPHQPQ